MTSLGWGRSYLMCPPTHYGVLYEINPWMHKEVRVDRDRARAQWEQLCATLREAGAEVVVAEADESVPDMVFTANAGIVNSHGGRRNQWARQPNADGAAPQSVEGMDAPTAGPVSRAAREPEPPGEMKAPIARSSGGTRGAEPPVGEPPVGQFIPSHFRFLERRGETEIFAAWFAARGFVVDRLPTELDHEGAGDALPFGGGLLSGYRFRSDLPATTNLARLTGVPVLAVELVDPRLYHIDITFCPLDDRRAICAPMGWDSYGRRVVERLVPEPLWLEDTEALSFCANSVVVGRTVVMPTAPPRVAGQLEAWGFDVVVCDVSEFLKAGGGCRCLTLALDVDLARTGPPVAASSGVDPAEP